MAGILLHQGEADWTADAQRAWQGKVTGIYADLKKDLGLGDVPFLIGELRSDTKGCCRGNNAYIAQTAQALPQGYAVSSANLTVNPNDAYHFDANGLREFGKRFAASYLQAPKPTGLAHRAGGAAAAPWHLRTVTGARILEFDRPQDRILVQDLRGRTLADDEGRALHLPTDAKSGLLLVRTQSGSAEARFTLPGFR
jgi:hypothetical protein